MQTTNDIVQKLWNLCSLLREDGVTYHQYVTELTYLLFLKMLEGDGARGRAPRGPPLEGPRPEERHGAARLLQAPAAEPGRPGLAARARHLRGRLHHPAPAQDAHRAGRSTSTGCEWYSETREDLGDLYEGLLEKNATEVKSGAGQYFTPRPLVESMVALVKPQPGERVQDPAAGTGGFLIAADRYVKDHTDDLFTLETKQQVFQKQEAFYGVELVPDTRTLALMNLMLHDIEGDLRLGDTLSPQRRRRCPRRTSSSPTRRSARRRAAGGRRATTSPSRPRNKQLAFLQHIYRGLKPGGRAAVVVPDNVLFEDNVGAADPGGPDGQVRPAHDPAAADGHLLRAGREDERAVLHARARRTRATRRRCGSTTCAPTCPRSASARRSPASTSREFEKAFGEDPHGKSKRKDQGEQGRFRKFTREEITGPGRQPRHLLAAGREPGERR